MEMPMNPVEQSTLASAAHLKEKRGPYPMLASAAIVLGLVLGIAGVLHTASVISVALRQGKPYDFRLV